MKLRPRPSPSRCVVCRDSDDVRLCPSCGAGRHLECAGRCPTIGCPGETLATAAQIAARGPLDLERQRVEALVEELNARREGRTHRAANGAWVRPPEPDQESNLARVLREWEDARIGERPNRYPSPRLEDRHVVGPWDSVREGPWVEGHFLLAMVLALVGLLLTLSIYLG